MTGIDSLLYKSSRGAEELAAADGEDEGLWTPKMEAETRLKAYQFSRASQRIRCRCEGGVTLGVIADVLEDMFSGSGDEWVVLESVRRPDAYMDVS